MLVFARICGDLFHFAGGHVLGIDPSATIPDHNGRPQYLLDDRDPVRELI